MSKGILNNRDKFVWDNAHKPTIDDAVTAVDDELDDLLDDHDDKIMSIVSDNAAAISLISDKSGITSTPVKVGKWDATNDIYAMRFSRENLPAIEDGGNFANITIVQANNGIIACKGSTYVPSAGQFYPVNTFFSVGSTANSVYSSATSIYYRYGSNFVGGTTTSIIYFLVSTT